MLRRTFLQVSAVLAIGGTVCKTAKSSLPYSIGLWNFEHCILIPVTEIEHSRGRVAVKTDHYFSDRAFKAIGLCLVRDKLILASNTLWYGNALVNGDQLNLSYATCWDQDASKDKVMRAFDNPMGRKLVRGFEPSLVQRGPVWLQSCDFDGLGVDKCFEGILK